MEIKVKACILGALFGIAAANSCLASTAETAPLRHPPVNESCRKWVLSKEAEQNWEHALERREWVCLMGEATGERVKASASRDPASSTPVPPTPPEGGCTGGGNSCDHRNNFDHQKGNNGRGTTGKNDAGDPPGGGNTGNDPN